MPGRHRVTAATARRATDDGLPACGLGRSSAGAAPQLVDEVEAVRLCAPRAAPLPGDVHARDLPAAEAARRPEALLGIPAVPAEIARRLAARHVAGRGDGPQRTDG